jgi:hypothetical protein
MLWWLVNFISSKAFRDYTTIEDVLRITPPDGETFWRMEWADDMLDKPVFPQWSVDGPQDKAKNDKAWGNDVSNWAKRAGFLDGVGLHAIRREILIKLVGTEPTVYPAEHETRLTKRDQILAFLLSK